MLGIFVISLLASIGLAILIVEKGEEWPIVKFTQILHDFLIKINPNLACMLQCTVCTSFWTALVTDLFLFISTGGSYFLWPMTGFAACGLTWVIIEFLNLLDSNE